MFGSFMPLFFMIGVLKCHLFTWLYTRIILKFLYVRFDGGCVDQDEGFGDVWDIHAIFDHDRGLIMSSFHLALHKDHFDISYVWFGGGHVGPDDGYEDVWISHVIVVHDRGLKVSS